MEYSAEIFESPYMFTGVQREIREFWDKAQRDSHPGEEPPVVLDEKTKTPMVGLDLLRVVEEYGRPKSLIFEVRVPSAGIGDDLVPGQVLLVEAKVRVYADRNGKLRESWTATAVDNA